MLWMKNDQFVCPLLSCLLMLMCGSAPAADEAEKPKASYVNLTVVGKLDITENRASITAKGWRIN